MEQSIVRILRGSAERGLPCLLSGENAVILLGYTRTTIDLDFMVPQSMRSRWLDLMRELGWRFYNGTTAFAQFEAPEKGGTPVDLMFVEHATWEKLLSESLEMNLAGESVRLPKPEFLVALKLHSASSPTRSKPESDWEDIRQIVQICHLNHEEPVFRKIILRYGGEMPSTESKNSQPADSGLPGFPTFDQPMIEAWPLAMSWPDAVRQMAPFRDYNIKRYDTAERRFADKNPEPFVLD